VVAEKQAALDVVRRRLERIGLAPFVLDLYGEKQTSRTIRRTVYDAMGFTASAEDPACTDLEAAYRDSLRELDEYRHLVHGTHPASESLWSVWMDALVDHHGTPARSPSDHVGSHDHAMAAIAGWRERIDAFDPQTQAQQVHP